MSKSKKRVTEEKHNASNEYCHIVYINHSRKNKVYRTQDILINVNYQSNSYLNPACIIYDVNTKKVLHSLSSVDIRSMTVSEYGNEYNLNGYECCKRKKDVLFHVQVFTDCGDIRTPDDMQLFSGFDLADAFSDNFRNYLGKTAILNGKH